MTVIVVIISLVIPVIPLINQEHTRNHEVFAFECVGIVVYQRDEADYHGYGSSIPIYLEHTILVTGRMTNVTQISLNAS